MLRCSRLAEKERKKVPADERAAVAAEIQELLGLRDEYGRRLWSQARLGEALGGLSQETIRRAMTETGVTAAVRDGLLRHLKTTMPALVAKHGAKPSARVVVPTARYDSREAAIATHVRYAEHSETAIRTAADAVGVALHAGDDPGERWWYEQIDAELKRKRPRLGVRVITEDDEPPKGGRKKKP